MRSLLLVLCFATACFGQLPEPAPLTDSELALTYVSFESNAHASVSSCPAACQCGCQQGLPCTCHSPAPSITTTLPTPSPVALPTPAPVEEYVALRRPRRSASYSCDPVTGICEPTLSAPARTVPVRVVTQAPVPAPVWQAPPVVQSPTQVYYKSAPVAYSGPVRSVLSPKKLAGGFLRRIFGLFGGCR